MMLKSLKKHLEVSIIGYHHSMVYIELTKIVQEIKTMRKYNTINDVLKMLQDRKAYIRYKIGLTDERETRKMQEWLDREKELDLIMDRILKEEKQSEAEKEKQ